MLRVLCYSAGLLSATYRCYTQRSRPRNAKSTTTGEPVTLAACSGCSTVRSGSLRWWVAGPQRINWAILPVFVHAVASARVSLGLALSPDAPMAAVLFSGVNLAGASAAAVAAVGAHAVVVVVLDLLAAPSGRARRLVELSALAYWSQVAWSVPAALLVTGAGSVGDDLRVVLDATRQLWGVWLIGLHAAVLYVVSGLSVAGAVAAALIMLAVFYGLPPLVGMIGSQLLDPRALRPWPNS